MATSNLQRLTRAALGCIAIAALAPAVSQAQVYHFYWWQSVGGTPQGLDITLTLTEANGQLNFRVDNNSTIESVVSEVYVESNSVLSNGVVLDGPGVDFEVPSSSPNPNGISPWAGTFFSAKAQAPAPHWGVNEGEYLDLGFDGSHGAAASGIYTRDFRFAIHVRGLDESEFGDGSIWMITPIPLPPSVWLLGSGLVGLVGSRVLRRRRS